MNAGASIVKVYYCYAQEDEALREGLTTHLSPLRRARKLTIWFDVEVQAGSYWKLEVEQHLKEADLILLLVSPNFIASDYCYTLQLTRALNYYEAGTVEIIPILLRPVLWGETLIRRLPLILPTGEVPVTQWPDRDEAFINVARAIRDIIQMKLLGNRQIPAQELAVLDQMGESVLLQPCSVCGQLNRVGAKYCSSDGTDLLSDRMRLVPRPLPPLRDKETWLKEGQLLFAQKRYIDALDAYEQALRLDPRFETAHFYQGHVFYMLQRYAEALAAYEQAIRYSPDSAAAYCHKAHTLRHLERYAEALTAYEQAIQLGSREISASAYDGKRHIYELLGLEEEAKAAFSRAISLNPDLYGGQAMF